MATMLRPGNTRIVVQRMAWNLNTQKRHLKHTDAPPADCDGWQASYGGYYLSRSYASDQQIIHQVLLNLISSLENEPNRWFQVVLYGDSGYPTGGGWISDGKVSPYRSPLVLLGPFCKEKGVMPDFYKNDDGLYVLPFNLPEGASTAIEYDESKPDFGEELKPEPKLVPEPLPPGSVIVAYDDWGELSSTFEVI